MSERRSSRVRKEVDYARLGLGGEDSPAQFIDDDDDEDFAEPTPPPTKKQKKDKLKRKEKSNVAVNTKKAKERPTLDDKLYERDLQMALEISVIENSETDKKEVGIRVLSPPRLQHEAIVVIEHEGIVSEEPPTLNRVSEEEMEQEETKENVGLANTNVAVVTDTSRIEVLEEDVSSPVKKLAARRRKPPKAKYNFDDSDSSEEDGAKDDDFRPNAQDSAPESEDDFCPDDDDDSDFDGAGSKNKSKAKPEKTSSKSKKPTVRGIAKSSKLPAATSKPATPITPSPITSTGLKKTPALSTKVTPKPSSGGLSSPLPSAHSPGIGLHRKFTLPTSSRQSPASLGRISITSPGGGGLRLGLSRNIKIKPLHANVKVPH